MANPSVADLVLVPTRTTGPPFERERIAAFRADGDTEHLARGHATLRRRHWTRLGHGDERKSWFESRIAHCGMSGIARFARSS